jgi:hypothetical protein
MARISGLCSAAPSERTRKLRAGVWMAVALATTAATLTAQSGPNVTNGPRFFADDPLWMDDDTALDASKVVPVEDTGTYDFVVNTFASPGERRDIRAMNVNTLDEVPDSSWFVNRIGRTPMTPADLARGPDRVASISLEGWVVSGAKTTGRQPGFRMTDPKGHLHQIEIDPPSHPELATGAEVIGTAFYHAFGYHTVDVYLAELDPERLAVSEKATQWDPREGRRRRFLRRDVDNVLRRGARQANGKYRVLVSRFADGKPLGNFRYYGTRPDDPNDIVPHEHRRELRAAHVFGAWLNHDDSRGVNSLDMLTANGSRQYVKHYMFDFGSILGSGTVQAQRHRAGNEYLLEWKPGWLTLATLGLYTRPWMHIDYPPVPRSIGRFEGDAFDPEKWKPEYPNAAFENMRPDDAFWAARIISRFDAASVRAIVEKARFSDPRATEYLTDTLLKRREKVLRVWLTQINPLVDFALSQTGELTFANAAEKGGVATAARRYEAQWAQFDNATGQATPVGDPIETAEPRMAGPPSLLSAARTGDFIEVRIAARHDAHPSWATPITIHFRRANDAWTLVGVRRLPDERSAAAAPASP